MIFLLVEKYYKKYESDAFGELSSVVKSRFSNPI